MIPLSEQSVGGIKNRRGGRQGRPGGAKRLRSTGMRPAFRSRILGIPSKRPPVLTDLILKCVHRPELPFTLSWLMDCLRSRKIKTTAKRVQTRLNAMVRAGQLKVVRVGRGGRQAHRPTSYMLVEGGGR